MGYLDICDKLINHPNPFEMDIAEAKDLRLQSIQGSFEHHYRDNEVYRTFCDKFGVKPDDIKTSEDIPKIALITSDFFKQVSAYKEEDLNRIISVPKKEIVTYFTTSGTTGKPSKYPFDRDSLIRLNKSNVQIMKHVGGIEKDDKFIFLTPGLEDTQTAMVHGMYQLLKTYFGESVKDQVHFAQKVKDGKAYYLLDDVLKFITGDGVTHLYGPPFAYKDMAEMLIENKETVKMGENSKAFTTGGWKGRKDEMITPRELNEMIDKAYGIDEANVRDGLGLTDIFSIIMECDQKKKHVPPWMYVSARLESDDLKDLEKIMPKNQEGIIAFLTPMIESYPAFITTGDLGALTTNFNESCECGRIGPTVEYRGRSGDPRGCALEELKKMQTSAFVLIGRNNYEGHARTKIT